MRSICTTRPCARCSNRTSAPSATAACASTIRSASRETVLGPGWSEARIKKLIGGKERYVNLAHPLPIHIEYFTAEVDDLGRLQLRDDVYGYSRKVRAALGLEG